MWACHGDSEAPESRVWVQIPESRFLVSVVEFVVGEERGNKNEAPARSWARDMCTGWSGPTHLAGPQRVGGAHIGALDGETHFSTQTRVARAGRLDRCTGCGPPRSTCRAGARAASLS